jgi:hypothetical protein
MVLMLIKEGGVNLGDDAIRTEPHPLFILVLFDTAGAAGVALIHIRLSYLESRDTGGMLTSASYVALDVSKRFFR